jgi:hypothetical protein
MLSTCPVGNPLRICPLLFNQMSKIVKKLKDKIKISSLIANACLAYMRPWVQSPPLQIRKQNKNTPRESIRLFLFPLR